MRWFVPKKPSVGDRRIIKRFLIFPKRIDDEVRWFELAYIEQSYRNDYNADWRVEYWKSVWWSTKEEYNAFREKLLK